MKSYKVTSLILLILPVCWIAFRIAANTTGNGMNQFGHQYEVHYDFTVRTDGAYWIKTFLPKDDHRQEVKFLNQNAQSTIDNQHENLLVKWEGNTNGLKHINLNFSFSGKEVKYDISELIPYDPFFSLDPIRSLSPTTYIQSDHPRINAVSDSLKADQTGLKSILKSFYSYVFAMPSSGTNELTDALTALNNYEASCNGKSRLLVALCRSQQIPARMVGGIIMETSDKKTSHAWVEILINDSWVPFDPLNGYFAALPAHYLQLYTGDSFLITRSPGVTFDYQYKIREQRNNSFSKGAIIDLWALSEVNEIPLHMLRVLLLLPLGALLIGILKNVIGFKTIGVFLPVLISIALIQTGAVTGIVLFTIVVFLVAGLNYPLTRWGVQHTAKLTLLMSAVVVAILAITQLLSTTSETSANVPLFFPFIILTLVAEKVARTIDEEGPKPALEMYVQTLLVTLLVFFVLNAKFIQDFLITFPEIIISFAGINLMLGKWIGLRVLEYPRFLNVIRVAS